MRVFSAFDGISCGQQALFELSYDVSSYLASEINKHAIKVTYNRFPNTIQLGNITKIKAEHFLNPIDLMIGGSPCQSLSGLGDGSGLNGKSGLFFEYIRLRDKLKPKYWLLENVVPHKNEWLHKMNEIVGCKGVLINSDMFIPQSRPRMYWTNIPFEYPEIENTETLQTLLQIGADIKYDMPYSWRKWWKENKDFQLKKSYSSLDRDTALCLTKRMYSSWNGNFVTRYDGTIRRLTPIECELLQMLPKGYTEGISDAQRYEALGNCWTIGPIKHILKHIPH